MKSKFLYFLFAAALLAFGLTAEARQLKVLALGNSFTGHLLPQLSRVAAAYPGCELDVAILCIGGGTLQRHWEYAEKAKADPTFRPYGVGRSYAFDKEAGARLPKTAGLPEMLKADRWDVVTIQAESCEGAYYEKFRPYADKLVALIRERAPQAEIRAFQTWSYTPYDGRLKGMKMTPETMHEALKASYGKFAADNGFRRIPVGDAIALYRRQLPVRYEKVLTAKEIAAIEKPGTVNFYHDPAGRSYWGKGGRGDRDRDEIKLRVDGHHLNDEGRYLQACVWVGALFGVDMTKLTYEPKELAQSEGFAARAKLMRECAAQALK